MIIQLYYLLILIKKPYQSLIHMLQGYNQTDGIIQLWVFIILYDNISHIHICFWESVVTIL